MTDVLQVGGFVPFTTIDFPGRNAAVVFCQGCMWRCSYCQNKELQSFVDAGSNDERGGQNDERGGQNGEHKEMRPFVNAASNGEHNDVTLNVLKRPTWEYVLEKIYVRRNFLDGVVFSGGEPLAQNAIINAVQDVRNFGLQVGIHTSGAYPELLDDLVTCTNGKPLLDWVGLDIKTCFDEYDALTGAPGSEYLVTRSLDILLGSSVCFDCRTTVDPKYVSPEHVIKIARELRNKGVLVYKLQQCYDRERNPVYSPCFENEFAKQLQSLSARKF
ncbi:MAG: radical SAM protein [Holosporales bacterium]|jgi:pyruvate formate lyase activating enzyme|nr:radical SAM protein [Holosporales bacterium]